MSVSTIRTGIATNLATIAGLRTASTVPDDPKPPVAIVVPNNITYDTSFARGADTYEFSVLVLVGRVDERTSQNRLDAYCTPTGGIKAAVESDKSLGGAAMSLRVTEMRNYQSLAVGEATYLAAEFVVQVIA